MPMPVGGFFALARSMGSSRSCCASPEPTQEELEQYAFRETQRDYAHNLKCTIDTYEDYLPARSGKITGVLLIEAKKEFGHDGIFILLKGYSFSKRKRAEFQETNPLKKPVTSVKFVVLGYPENVSDGSGRLGAYTIEPGVESYPLELSMPKNPKELPYPMINTEGKLIYRMQAYISTEGRHVLVAETTIEFQGYNNLLENPEETSKSIKTELQLQYKRSVLSRRKTVDIFFSVDNSGCLPEELIDFLVVTRNPDKIPLQYSVELVEKLWFQIPSPRQRQPATLAQSATAGRRMSVKLETGTVVNTEKIENEKVSDEMVWKGTLRIPPGVTPTYKFDFLNSVSYTLKITVMVVGNEDTKVVSEAPFFIGTTRESDTVDGEEPEDDDDGDFHSGAETPGTPGTTLMQASRSLNCIYNCQLQGPMSRSRSRAESISSTHSFDSYASSTPSIFRMPPSYSQLSSRRPTLETLPPTYSDVELHDHHTVTIEYLQVPDCVVVPDQEDEEES